MESFNQLWKYSAVLSSTAALIHTVLGTSDISLHTGSQSYHFVLLVDEVGWWPNSSQQILVMYTHTHTHTQRSVARSVEKSVLTLFPSPPSIWIITMQGWSLLRLLYPGGLSVMAPSPEGRLYCLLLAMSFFFFCSFFPSLDSWKRYFLATQRLIRRISSEFNH